MFGWFFSSCDDIEFPVSDREFDFVLHAEAPPPAPQSSLAYDDEVSVSSQPLSAMQQMFNPTSFKVNFLWWKFHQDLCRKLN